MASRLDQIIAAIDELAAKELWYCSSGVLGGEVKGRYDALMEAADIIRKHVDTEETSRQRFEAWLRQDYERRRRRFNKSIWRDHTTGEYGDREDETAWKAWQASQTFTEA